MGSHSGLIFRKSARFDLSLPSRIRVSEAHGRMVSLTASAGVKQGWLPVDVVDFSAGGLGLLSGVFVPRRCVLDVEIFTVENDRRQLVLSGVVRVQRVVMTDRRPAYLIGAAFESPSEEQVEQIERLLELLGGVDETEGEARA